jgi:hypothetical protein
MFPSVLATLSAVSMGAMRDWSFCNYTTHQYRGR